MGTGISRLPEWAKRPLRRLRNAVGALPYQGTGRYCPVCDKSSGQFRAHGHLKRKDAQCAHCGAVERHRFVWLYLRERTNLLDGIPKKMLHVAPEACLEAQFNKYLGKDYLTADLFDPRAMVKMDITDIQYEAQTFDVIYCSHVLEHVPEDRKAMGEFHRVLRDDGWAILLVPVTSETTFEDPSIVEPEDRLRVFGHEGHVRTYGPDYADRLREAGFTVLVTEVSDLVSQGEARQMGLSPESGQIYFCTRASAGESPSRELP